jgi:dipeptidyl aminopeptidase/acylaminoacyl peptidase
MIVRLLRGAFLTALAACSPLPAVAIHTPSPSQTASPSPTAEVTPTHAAPPAATATPNPLEGYSIEYLRDRAYGGGEVEAVQRVGANSAFTRYLIRYPSDGLYIHGFMNIPLGEGPYPVVIALHGYIDPGMYDTFDYTTHYADALASAGYLVVHPNLRGYPPSDEGDNLFRVGMAIDVLNLIAVVQSTAGQPGALEAADGARIGLWGHSMGGGVVTRVITISDDVRAAVLYAAMSGDEKRNYEAIGVWSGGERGVEERQVAEAELAQISPIYYLNDIGSAVSIHHGLEDELVPVQWSMQTCELMRAAALTVECLYYEDMPHTFRGQGDKEFIQYTIQFMDRHLMTP